MFFAVFDRIRIPYRTARLDESGNACLMCNLHTVIKGEESITGKHGSMKISIELLCLDNCLPQCVYAACLSTAFSNKPVFFYERNGIAFKMLADDICKC